MSIRHPSLQELAWRVCSRLERRPREECEELIEELMLVARRAKESKARRWMQNSSSTRSMLAKYGILLTFKTFTDDGYNLSPIGDAYFPDPHVWICEGRKNPFAREKARKRYKRMVP